MQADRTKIPGQVLELLRRIGPALCVAGLLAPFILFTAQPRALAQGSVATQSRTAATVSAQPTANPLPSATKFLTLTLSPTPTLSLTSFPTSTLSPTSSPTSTLSPTSSPSLTLSSPTSTGIRNATRLPPPVNIGTLTTTAVLTQSSPAPAASRNPALAFGTIAGKYLLSGRSVYSGTIITANPGGYTATTIADGSFSLSVLEGTYSVTAMMPGYLPTQKVGAAVAGGGLNKLPNAIAIAGNADGSNAIDARALGIIGGAFGRQSSSLGYDIRADLNADGVINILDLVLATSHFGMSGAQPWP